MKIAFQMMMVASTLGALVACGGTKCKAGDTCACDGQGSCEWDCPGGDCDYEASGQGNIDLTCDGGGCRAAVSGQGTVRLDCGGGDCTMTNDGQGVAELTCSAGGCSMSCSGQGTCVMIDCEDCATECKGITTSCKHE